MTGASVLPPAAVAPKAEAGRREAVIRLVRAEPHVYARSVSGWFAGWRWTMVWLTQIVFYGVPWLNWNGRQAMLFDIAARRFYVGPLVLYPQDFIYLTALLVVSAYALFLFTALFGRLWCGYACPQTVYTEIFMWVEQRVEGNRPQRMRLDAARWGVPKLARKAVKHAVWIGIALWTGFTFVGYFTPIRSLAAAVPALAFGPWESFWVLFYATATYGNAGWLREQVCKYMCPYARFQGVMFDKDTLVIGYDVNRGEPRGRSAKVRAADRAGAGLGDCIDCGLCVQVCPTGIDIRRGLQHECIGCAACIDACNGVMDKMHYPRGLIRYDTQRGVDQGLTRHQTLRTLARPRVLVYAAVLASIGVALAFSLATRTPFRVDVVRDRGVLARQVDDGAVENVYRLQLMNATEAPQRYRTKVEGMAAAVVRGNEVDVGPAQSRWVPVAVRLAPDAALHAGPGTHRIDFVVERLPPAGRSAPGPSVREPSTFIVPR